MGTCATSKETLSVKTTRACLLHHSSRATMLQVILNVNKEYCPSFSWHPSFSLSGHYTTLSCWFQFYFLFKNYFNLSILRRIVISDAYHALVFPIIFLCSSLLIPYLFIAPHDILSYQFSRTKTNNSISVEDHSYVRKVYILILWYSMKQFFCAFGPHLTWSFFASIL